jgi:hypothetical protein
MEVRYYYALKMRPYFIPCPVNYKKRNLPQTTMAPEKTPSGTHCGGHVREGQKKRRTSYATPR